MAILAIEIDDLHIHVASAKIGKQRCVIDDLFSISIEDGDDKRATELLKQALSEHGLSRRETIVVVSRASVEMREITVPPAPDNELPSMVRLIARTEFASLNDNWLLDFIPVDYESNKPRKIIAMGISPEYHRQINNIVENSGLKIKHMVLRPLATVDLVQSRLQDRRCRLVVSPHGDQTDLTVLRGMTPVATRTVRIPTSSASEHRIRQKISEIKRTLASSQEALGGESVEEMILIGNQDEHASAVPQLEEQLELAVTLVPPFDQVESSSRLTIPADSARFAGLLGCLLQESHQQRHTIDFINPRRPVEKTTDRSRLYLYGGLAAAGVILAIGFGWWTLRSQAQEISQLEKDLAAAVRVNEGDSNKPSVEQIMGEVAKIDDWKKSDVNWLDEIYELSNRFLTPDDAIVDSLDASLSRTDPRIIAKIRGAGTQTEEALNEQLRERPYLVTQGKTSESDEDPSYASSFDVTLVLSGDRSELIERINEKTTELIQQRNTRSDSTDADDNTPESE